VPVLVREAELLWVVTALEPATTREIATQLPIDQNSTYVRLRSLSRRGALTQEKPTPWRGSTSQWETTASGQERVTAADLPPAGETDFETYFEGRSLTIDTGMFLDELAVRGAERAAEEATADHADAPEAETDAGDVTNWVPTPTITAAVPFNPSTVRTHLHQLTDQGLLDLDSNRVSAANYWRLTEQGQDRLATMDAVPYSEPDETAPATDTRRVDHDRLLAEVACQALAAPPASVSAETTVTDGSGPPATETGWVPSTALYDALPFSKVGIRDKLHSLKAEGYVEQDTERGGQEHYWRLTQAGLDRLADAEPDEAQSLIWL